MRTVEHVRLIEPEGVSEFMVETVSMGETTFEGQAVLMTEAASTPISNTNPELVSSPARLKSYYEADNAAARLRVFGHFEELESSPFEFDSITTVISPPMLVRFDLSPGESYAQTTVSEFRFSDGSTVQSLPSQQTSTYVGRETVSVPAGTLNTCRFEQVSISDGREDEVRRTTTWYHVGSGLVARELEVYEIMGIGDSAASEIVLVSAAVDGEPIR